MPQNGKAPPRRFRISACDGDASSCGRAKILADAVSRDNRETGVLAMSFLKILEGKPCLVALAAWEPSSGARGGGKGPLLRVKLRRVWGAWGARLAGGSGGAYL